MNKFTTHTGTAAPLYRPHTDTDQIIPKQFLKRIERTGYGEFLFYDWRFSPDGTPEPDFVLNDAAYSGSSVLLAGHNFGCGSSREHAPWSLLDYGFRAVIASSFADIFYNNSLKNGLLAIALTETDVADLVERTIADPKQPITIDLEAQTVSRMDGFERQFAIDPFRKHCILNGLDDIALTLQQASQIVSYERNDLNDPRFSFLRT